MLERRMAKDTEKLIRQLSLISFLMAERRSVTALEIKQEVEGYSGMNDEAFARRFYADRAELESLGIERKVEKPAEGYYEAENYTLPAENFYLPAIEFSDAELGALRTALALLDGEFAYAEPLRLALQQLSFGKPSPLTSPESSPVTLGVKASAGGRELSQRLSKIETAIFRRKTIVFDYYTMGRDAQMTRRVDPYHLVFQNSQFYLIGYSHEREDVRVFRLSRIQGKVAYSSKAEHDFQRPQDFNPRIYAKRTEWQLGETIGTARIWISPRKDWLVLRHHADAGKVTTAGDAEDSPFGEGVVFETEYSDERAIVSWVLAQGELARMIGPPELVQATQERLELIVDRHRSLDPAPPTKRRKQQVSAPQEDSDGGKREAPIRPERFARLVTLAGILIEAARQGEKLDVRTLCDNLQVSEEELREDIDVLNVVNFGGGSYVLYAEVQGDQVEVDPEPYGDNFAKPARLLPLEAKALIAAIDLIGEHLFASLATARKKIVKALGQDPATDGLQITSAEGDSSEIARVASEAIRRRRLLEIDYYKENEDELTTGRVVEPYHMANGSKGWYVHAWDPAKNDSRTFRLDRIRSATVLKESYEPREGIEPPDARGWLSTGEVPESKPARVWVSPERARWAREDSRVVEELRDGAVIIEQLYAGENYLVGEVLKGAGDFAVIEPEEAREAVLEAAEALAGAVKR
jgi:proteasome accessory factor C